VGRVSEEGGEGGRKGLTFTPAEPALHRLVNLLNFTRYTSHLAGYLLSLATLDGSEEGSAEGCEGVRRGVRV
jgi:hypothetical protein